MLQNDGVREIIKYYKNNKEWVIYIDFNREKMIITLQTTQR